MSKKNVSHWKAEEELNYHFFLICTADELLKS